MGVRLASRGLSKVRHGDPSERFLAAGRGLLQRLQQSVVLLRVLALAVMGKEVCHIGDLNAVRRGGKPEAAFRSTAGLDKSGPRHHLQNLGGLRGRETGRRRNLMSL